MTKGKYHSIQEKSSLQFGYPYDLIMYAPHRHTGLLFFGEYLIEQMSKIISKEANEFEIRWLFCSGELVAVTPSLVLRFRARRS